MQEFIDTSLDIIHFSFGAVGSTNDEAFRLAEERGYSRLLVSAESQTSGRGRRGRGWVSEPGNLYMSLFLRRPSRPEHCSELSFVAAVALHGAIADCVNGQASSCTLKWPNDVLWEGAKIAGLLLEAKMQSGEINCVIGIGVNCNSYPHDTPYPATSFKARGIALSADELFAEVKRHLLLNIDLWNGGKNFEAIRLRWLQHAQGLGDALRVRLADEEIDGHFLDLDPKGRLVLQLSNQTKRIITAGDVFFPARTR